MATYYVSPSGNDSNPGSQMNPWLTLTHAAASIAGGDIVNVANGTYTLTSGTGNIEITANGIDDAHRTTFQAINKWGAKIINNITAANDNVNDPAIFIGANFVDVIGFDISGANGRVGIYGYGQNLVGSGSPAGSYIRVKQCYVHDLGQNVTSAWNDFGILVGQYNGSLGYTGQYNEVTQCVVNNIGPLGNDGCHGIYLTTGHGICQNNIVSNIPGFGINIFHFPHHMTITNNLVFNCGASGLFAGGIYISAGGTGYVAGTDEPCDFCTIGNNIIAYCNGRAGIYEEAPSNNVPIVVQNNTFTNNCYQNNVGILNFLSQAGSLDLNTVPQTPTTVSGSDTFIRANTSASSSIASGWGTASNGNVWTSAGLAATWQIVSNQGKVTGTNNDTFALLTANSYSNIEIVVRVSSSVSSATNWQGALLRYQGTANCYYAILRGTHFTIGRLLTNSHTNVVDTTFTQAINTEYWIRFNATGSTLSAKVWQDGTTEPGAWTLQGTDTSFTAGQIGLMISPDAVGTTAVYDNYTYSGTQVNDPDPRFINYQPDGSGDYHIQHNSPCVDAGTSTGAPSNDLDGNSRPQISGYDIGPYEYVPVAPIIDVANQTYFIEATTLSFERTIGRRSQASCTLLTTTATHFQQDEQVAIYDIHNGLVFSGYITSPKESKPGFQPTLEHDISCVDQHRIADKRIVAATYTSKTAGYIAMDIYNNILASEGVTIGLIYDGAALADLFPNTTVFPSTTLYPTENVGVIPSAIFAYCTVAQALDELVKAASSAGVPYYWMIDERKRFWFVPYTAVVNSTVIDGTQVDDGHLSGQAPQVTRANPTYRNTQYLLGGVAQTVTQNETRKGDGNTTSWPMNFDLASAPTITVNTVAKTVGIRGLDTGKDWYWQKGSPDISQDSSGTKLISTDTLAVTYIGQYPTVIIDQNTAQVSYTQSLSAGTGIVEEVETDNTITSVANGLATTSQLLTRYAQQGLILEFMTRDSSFGPGQLVTVNLPDHGINNEQMLIEEVTASDQVDGLNIWYDVKAIQGPYDMNWVAFFSKTLAQQTIANSINVGIGQSVVIAASGYVTFFPSITGSATVNACPVPSTSTFPGLALFPC